MRVFVSFRVVMPGTLAEVTSVVWFADAGAGVVSAGSQRQFVCENCGTRLDRDLNAARNLAALADQAVLGELRPDVKRPDGNPPKTGMAGNGYRRGKAQIMSQGRLREGATP